MLTQVCQELRNWFDRRLPKYLGEFTISNGELVLRSGMVIQDGQYYRIIGSVFNDGVHQYGADTLKDETFNGAVWQMSVPPAVVQLAEEIADWQAKFGGSDSQAMSPFASESFGGYSYTKAGGSVRADGSSAAFPSWQSAFESRLNAWRKI